MQFLYLFIFPLDFICINSCVKDTYTYYTTVNIMSFVVIFDSSLQFINTRKKMILWRYLFSNKVQFWNATPPMCISFTAPNINHIYSCAVKLQYGCAISNSQTQKVVLRRCVLTKTGKMREKWIYQKNYGVCVRRSVSCARARSERGNTCVPYVIGAMQPAAVAACSLNICRVNTDSTKAPPSSWQTLENYSIWNGAALVVSPLAENRAISPALLYQ